MLVHLSAPWFPHQGVANPILQSVRLGQCFWVAYRMQQRGNTDFLCWRQAVNGNSLPCSDWRYDKPRVFWGVLVSSSVGVSSSWAMLLVYQTIFDIQN